MFLNKNKQVDEWLWQEPSKIRCEVKVGEDKVFDEKNWEEKVREHCEKEVVEGDWKVECSHDCSFEES